MDDNIEVGLAIAAEQFSAGLKAVMAEFDGTMQKLTGMAKQEGQSMQAELNKGWSTLGMQSIEAIDTQILHIDAAVAAIRKSGASTEEMARVDAKANVMKAALNAEAGRSVGIFRGLGAALSSYGLSLQGIGAALVGQQFIKTNIEMERLARGLTAVEGDAGRAAADFLFITKSANQMGIEVGAAGRSFMTLAAASKGTALEGQATRDIYSAVGQAMTILGASSEQTERVFTALGQMISKGTVSAEELKNQLGDALPGAFQIAARAVGLMTDEFGKLMKEGGVISTSFLPRFAEAIKTAFGGAAQQASGVEASWNRLKNAWNNTMTTIGSTGLWEAMGRVLGQASIAVNGITQAFVVLGKSIGAIAGAVVTGNFSMLGDELRRIGQEGQDALDKVSNYGAAAKGAGEMSVKMAAGTTQAAQAQQKLAAATTAATGAAASAMPGWEALLSAYNKIVKASEEKVAQLKLTQEANNAEQASLVRLAEIGGNEARQVLARAEAADVAAKSSMDLAKAMRQEADVANARVIALQQEADADLAKTGQVNKAKAEQIKALRDVALSKAEEARQSEALAESTRIEALAAQVAAKTYGDQAQQLSMLRAQYDEARAKPDALTTAQKDNAAQTAAARMEVKAAGDQLDLTKRQMAAGVATTYDLQVANKVAEEATRKLTEAEAKGVELKAKVKTATEGETKALARYRDAMDEAIAKIERRMRLDQQRADIAQKSLDIDVQLARNEEALAKIKGDETAAREANLRAMDLEAQKSQAAADASAKEANSLREQARLKEEKARRDGDLTDQTKSEIEALRLSAQAKDLDAQASAVAADGLAQQAAATREAQRALAALNDEMKRYDKNGWALNTEGKQVAQSLTDDQLKAAANNPMLGADQRAAWQFILAKRQKEIADQANKQAADEQAAAGQKQQQEMQQASDAAQQALQSRMDADRQAAANLNGQQQALAPDTAQAVAKTRTAAPTASQASTSPTQYASVHKIEFSFSGSAPVTVAADSDAEALRLIALLRRAGARLGR